jgi:hemoglobin/transferrin/lactoferrin receptor protein
LGTPPIIAALLLSLNQHPQATTAAAPGGRVIDGRTGAPIAAAEVSVVGSPGLTRTDADGFFVWTSPPMMPAVVIVTLVDGRVARPINLLTNPADSQFTVSVEPAVREAMTVIGTLATIDGAKGAAMLRIGQNDLALRHPATLVQALELVPGLGVVGEGQGAVPAIRGFARGRTLILVDGARASTERRAGSNASFVDPDAIAAVEVARGPGSVAYGSDAIGGVIAIQLKRPDHRSGWRGRLAGTLGGGVPEKRGDVEVSRGFDSGGLLFGLRAREFSDYESPSGRVANSSWRDQGARLAWEQDIGLSRLTVRWQSDLGRDLGRPRSDSNLIRVTSPIEDSHRLTASWQRPSVGAFRGLRVETLVGWANQRTDQDRLPTIAPTRPRSLEASETSHRDVQLRVVAERATGRARIQTGADLQGRYGLRARDTTSSFSQAGVLTSAVTTLSIDQANRTGAGVFVDATVPIARRLQATLGGRLDTVRNRNRGGFWGDRSASTAALAGVAALSVAPAEGASVTAQVARGFRDPTLSDRFYRGPVGRGVVEGNPDLTAETSVQFDLTARLTLGPLRAEVSGYNYRISDLIERYTVNSTLFGFRNRGAARFRGVEVAASVGLARGFAIELAAQSSSGRDAADETPLDDVAPEAVSVIVRHARGSRLRSYLRLGGYRAHKAAGPSEVPVPGYLIADLGASWRLSSKVVIQGTARNLFDDAYYASAGPRWVYAPGRQGALTITTHF